MGHKRIHGWVAVRARGEQRRNGKKDKARDELRHALVLESPASVENQLSHDDSAYLTRQKKYEPVLSGCSEAQL